MLLKESVKATDSGIIVQKTYDNDVHIEKARMLREAATR